jgi:hypothetical protein
VTCPEPIFEDDEYEMPNYPLQDEDGSDRAFCD